MKPLDPKVISLEDIILKHYKDAWTKVWYANLLKDLHDWADEQRLDEILQMRAVGDRVAAQAGATFEELSGAYDKHILKRAADLTDPTLSAKHSSKDQDERSL